MKRILILSAILFVVTGASGAEDKLTFGKFGTVHLYRRSEHPSGVVLFVSGDGGWNLGVVDMARELATLDALVVGIDIRAYLRAMEAAGGACSYPAADFEALGKFVQKTLGFPAYVPPVLVGYSSGATLAYATIVQAPPNTFRGAISMGFCPDLPLHRPLCKGSGLAWTAGPKGKGYSFLPAASSHTPWVAFQGDADKVCDPSSIAAFVKETNNAGIVVLPKVGHGFSVTKNWMPQFRDSFARLVAPRESDAPPRAEPVKDLPLVEVPATGPPSDTFAVIISGDGGWAGLDREVAGALSGHGVPTVGVNSLQYFWTPRNPDGAARDLERIVRHYLAAWSKERVLLIGYSLGADVLPFMTNRLPTDLLARVRQIDLIGPGRRVEFEFHVAEWLGGGDKGMPILPEVLKLKGRKILCFYGEEESDSLCKDLGPGVAQSVLLSGGHHFGGDYEGIATRILAEAK